MSSSPSRRRYTAQCTKDAVELSNESTQPATEIARNLGIRPELLYRWRREYRQHPVQPFPGSGHLPDPSADQIRQLQRQLAAVKTERDI